MTDVLDSEVRIPQAEAGTGRRKTLNLAVTAASSTHEIRDEDAATSECWITMQHQIAEGIYWHGGPDTAGVPLAAATVLDWVLPAATERSYKLAAGETHLSIIAGAEGVVQVYVSSD